MERNKGKTTKPRLAKLFASLLALLVWQLAAVLMNNRLLLVGPAQVARRLWALKA